MFKSLEKIIITLLVMGILIVILKLVIFDFVIKTLFY